MRKNKKGAGRPVIAPPPWGDLSRSVGGNEKLAEKLGVSKSTVNKWAMGIHRLPELARKETLRLCKYYGITSGLEKLESEDPI
jgi:transcriptional regulator with XRE-family HTH domain